MGDRLLLVAGTLGPAFEGGPLGGARTPTPSEAGSIPAPPAGRTGRGSSGHVVRDAAAAVGNGAGDGGGSSPAPGAADLAALQLAQEHGRLSAARTVIRRLERENASLRKQVAWWQTRASEGTPDRGTVVTGEIGHAWDAGAAEQRLRAAARLLRRAESDPAAMQSASWREELIEVLRFVEGLDR